MCSQIGCLVRVRAVKVIGIPGPIVSLVSLVKAMYENAKNKVTIKNEFSDEFPVYVCVHQGFLLSSFLLIIVLEAL